MEIRQQLLNGSISKALSAKHEMNKIVKARTHGRLWSLLDGRSELEIARKAGLPPQTVSAVLTGEREPRISTFLKIQKAIGCSAKDFYLYLVETWKAPINRIPAKWGKGQAA